MAVLRKNLNPVYLFHWTLLVGGIGMLCSDSISNEYLRNADQMLPDFVLLMGVLYGPTNCTRIVHLQHISHITCPEEDRLGHTAVLPLKV